MELFATDPVPLAFLLETDAALDLDLEALQAKVEAAAKKPSPQQGPNTSALDFPALLRPVAFLHKVLDLPVQHLQIEQ